MVNISQVNMPTPFASNRKGIVSGWSWKCLIVALPCLMWVGLPLTLIGWSDVVTAQIAAFFIIITAIPFIFICLMNGWGMNRFERMALIMLIIIVFITILSTSFIFEYGVSEWVPALYGLSPLLLCFSFRMLRVRVCDIINGIIVASLLVSIIVLFDRIFPVGALDFYTRFSSFNGLDGRRVVIMKTEVAIGACFFFARMIDARGLGKRFLALIGFLITFGYLSVIAESRLVLLAICLSICFYVIFIVKGVRKLISTVILLACSVFLFPYFIERYVSAYFSNANYLNEDASYLWRVLTLEYYGSYFDKTYGVGFGFLSQSPQRENFVSFATNYGGTLYGVPDYNIYMADTGIWGALFQFGYLGVFMVVIMTGMASLTLIQMGRHGISPWRHELGIAGALMLFFFLSPWPTNFFTLQWSCMPGAIFWSLASIGRYEELELRARQRHAER